MKDNNGWDEYKRLILASLESLQKETAILKEQHERMKEDFQTFLLEYKQNTARFKAYLTIGVALGSALMEIASHFLDKFLG